MCRDIPFPTSVEEIMNLPSIVRQMEDAGIDPNLVSEAISIAEYDQGVYDLISLWCDSEERWAIEHDLQDVIEDYNLVQLNDLVNT